jgi:hypothetical protein
MCSKTNCVICLGSVHDGLYPISQNFFKQLKLSGKYKDSKKTWPEKLKCGHVFHLKCIKNWFMGERDSSEKCPMCREKIKFSNKFGATSRRIYTEKIKKYESERFIIDDHSYYSDDSDDGDDMPPVEDGIHNSLAALSTTNHQIEEMIGGNNSNVISIINHLLTYHPWNAFSRSELDEILRTSISNIPQTFNTLYEQFNTTAHITHTPFRDSLVDYLMDRYDENIILNFSETTTLHMIAYILDNRSRTQTIDSEINRTIELPITNEINELYTVENVMSPSRRVIDVLHARIQSSQRARRVDFDNLSEISNNSDNEYHFQYHDEYQNLKITVLPPLLTWNKKNQKKMKKFTHNKRYFAKMNVHTCKKWKKY